MNAPKRQNRGKDSLPAKDSNIPTRGTSSIKGGASKPMFDGFGLRIGKPKWGDASVAPKKKWGN